jgi:sortase (surface protein transpeptidase)
LSKLKRRIFFISATLTREFKGTKYFIKKARTEDEWKQKKEERKQKRKQKEKDMFNKDNNNEDDKDKDKKDDL